MPWPVPPLYGTFGGFARDTVGEHGPVGGSGQVDVVLIDRHLGGDMVSHRHDEADVVHPGRARRAAAGPGIPRLADAFRICHDQAVGIGGTIPAVGRLRRRRAAAAAMEHHHQGRGVGSAFSAGTG